VPQVLLDTASLISALPLDAPKALLSSFTAAILFLITAPPSFIRAIGKNR
jgi:hypothetical protein